jgi:uncharacterized protein
MATSHGPAASPFVVSVRDFARQPGAQRSVSRVIPAPADLGTDVIGVPAGADLALELSLESVSEGIWVTGTVTTGAVGECSRCLDEVREDVSAPIQGLFALPGSESAGEEDEDVRDFDGENLDLEEIVRDAVVTTLPFVPLCDPECPGLCDQCGARLADDPDHRHDVVDPRWVALESLTEPKEK